MVGPPAGADAALKNSAGETPLSLVSTISPSLPDPSSGAVVAALISSRLAVQSATAAAATAAVAPSPAHSAPFAGGSHVGVTSAAGKPAAGKKVMVVKLKK